MNAPVSRNESGWATYLKAATFLLPAIFFWMLTVTFVAPKLKQVSADAGGVALPDFLQTMLTLTENSLWILLLLAIAIILLECLTTTWARYRKLAAGIAVFLLNSIVLTSLFSMLIAFAVVAPALNRTTN